MHPVTGRQVLEPHAGKLGFSADSFSSLMKQVLLLPANSYGYP